MAFEESVLLSSGLKQSTRTELAVLRAIWFGGAETRAQIGAQTGLSRPTVIAALNALRSQKLIRSERRKAGSLGRDPELLSIDPRAVVGLGVDVGGTKTSAAIVDLLGEIIAESTIPTVRGEPGELIASIATMRDQLLASAGLESRKVPFAAIGMPGVLQDDGRLLHTGTLTGLDTADVRGLFVEQLGCEVHIENDVNMAAYGELLNAQSFSVGTRVLISVGTGLGMGIVHGGEVIRGSTGHAGEIAFLPISEDLQSPEAKQHGAAELVVCGPKFESRYMALSGRRLSSERILQSYLDEDPHAATAVEEIAFQLARVVVSVAVTLDPEVIVMTGGLGSNSILLDPLRRAVEAISPLTVKLELARFGTRAGLVGATTYAQRHLQKAITSGA